MTIQDLEVLAADLYKAAEEDSPIFGHTAKKEWMAKKLEQDIEDDGTMLGHYLAYDDVEGVLNDLEQQYENNKHPKDEDELTVKDRIKDKKEEMKDKVSDRRFGVKKDPIRDRNDHPVTGQTEEKMMDEPEDEVLIVETNEQVILFETEDVDDRNDQKAVPSSQSGKCHR